MGQARTAATTDPQMHENRSHEDPPMTRLPFTQVDAFANRPFAGNPAAVMPLESWLPDETLLAIAAENNLSETAFTVPDATGAADYELRWFTPVVEIALCGHATLASAHVLMTDDAIRFRTRQAGILDVRRDSAGYAMSLPVRRPVAKAMPDLAATLGGEVLESWWHESGCALFVLADAAAVRALTPDFATMKQAGNILCIATAPGDMTDCVSRAFAPGAGIDEDPVTGSAHCMTTPYWAERLGKFRMTAYQASARGGHLTCALDGDRVVLGGTCRTVIEGVFLL